MVFENVTLQYDGEEYTVKAGDLWGLAEAVEEVVTLFWLAPRLQNGQYPAGRIFRAYAQALRYAGKTDADATEIAKGVTYKRLAEMAYELAGILSITQPQGDVNLGDPDDDGGEDEKKGQGAGSSGPATSSGASGGTTRRTSGASTRKSSGGSRKRN